LGSPNAPVQRACRWTYGLQVSGFGLQFSGFGSRVSCFVFRVAWYMFLVRVLSFARRSLGLTRAATRQSSQKLPSPGIFEWRRRRQRYLRRIPGISPHLDHALASERAGSQLASQTARRPGRPVYTREGIPPGARGLCPFPSELSKVVSGTKRKGRAEGTLGAQVRLAGRGSKRASPERRRWRALT